MTKFLSTLTIKNRIFFSFATIVIISVLFAAFNIYSLGSFYNHFKEFKHVSDDSRLMLKIDNDLSELRRLIGIFSHNNQIASIGDLESLHQKMRVDINDIIQQHEFKKHSDIAKLKKMQVSVNSFGEKFESLDKQRNLRDDYINHQLIDSFTKINHEMTLLSNNVGNHQNKRLIKSFWEAQLAISKAESISADYFNTRQFTKKKSVQQQLVIAEEQLVKALSIVQQPQIKRTVKTAITLVQDSMTTFNLATQSDRNYLFLLNIVIAGESAELSILSETLKEKSLAQEQQIYIDTEKDIVQNTTIAIAISVLVTFFAFAIALITGTLISQPLASITSTFRSLAHGVEVAAIPGVERNDEIGHLARAANVFNQKNLQTKALLSESKEMTEALQLREDQLEKKNEDLKSFTHIASHDLKSPIQGISDLAQWVEEDLGDDIPEEVKANLIRIRLRIERMQNLIDDLLKYSEFGMVSEDKSIVDVREMVEEVLELVTIPKTITFTVNGEVPPFESFRTPLQITLRNLVSNAVKHHDKPDGSISINLEEEKEEGYYVFEVQDNGPGIALDNQENIFLLFRTGGNLDVESTGMGLAFCKRMVDAHGGKIEVESVLGEGAIFRFWWPKVIRRL